MQGMQGRQQAWGGQQRMQEQPAQMLATEKYLFILKGNTVYQLDINSLKLLNQTQLGEPAKGANQQEMMKKKIMERAEQIKQKIEDLKAEGKDEEAAKLQAHLDRMMQYIEKGGNMKHKPGKGKEGGWKNKPKEKKADPHKEEDGLF